MFLMSCDFLCSVSLLAVGGQRFFCVLRDSNTHTSYIVTFSFNLMAIVCVIANLFFY